MLKGGLLNELKQIEQSHFNTGKRKQLATKQVHIQLTGDIYIPDEHPSCYKPYRGLGKQHTAMMDSQALPFYLINSTFIEILNLLFSAPVVKVYKTQ